MNFTYQGFTHHNGNRCFNFWSTTTKSLPLTNYSIEVDLMLLSRLRVSVQDGPMFCLEMLKMASAAGLESLEKLQRYQLVEEDFRPLLLEREKVAAEKASRRFLRKPFVKRSPQSSIVLGPSFPTHSHSRP
jgi:hypothetical protein